MLKLKLANWLNDTKAIIINDKRYTKKFNSEVPRLQNLYKQIEQIKIFLNSIDQIYSTLGVSTFSINVRHLDSTLRVFIASSEAVKTEKDIDALKPKLDWISEAYASLGGNNYGS